MATTSDSMNADTCANDYIESVDMDIAAPPPTADTLNIVEDDNDRAIPAEMNTTDHPIVDDSVDAITEDIKRVVIHDGGIKSILPMFDINAIQTMSSVLAATRLESSKQAVDEDVRTCLSAIVRAYDEDHTRAVDVGLLSCIPSVLAVCVIHPGGVRSYNGFLDNHDVVLDARKYLEFEKSVMRMLYTSELMKLTAVLSAVKYAEHCIDMFHCPLRMVPHGIVSRCNIVTLMDTHRCTTVSNPLERPDDAMVVFFPRSCEEASVLGSIEATVNESELKHCYGMLEQMHTQRVSEYKERMSRIRAEADKQAREHKGRERVRPRRRMRMISIDDIPPVAGFVISSGHFPLLRSIFDITHLHLLVLPQTSIIRTKLSTATTQVTDESFLDAFSRKEITAPDLSTVGLLVLNSLDVIRSYAFTKEVREMLRNRQRTNT